MEPLQGRAGLGEVGWISSGAVNQNPGSAVALSETLTFLSVLFWAVVLGPAGAILAVPLTLFVRTILLDSDPSIAWLRPLTGDRKDLLGLLKQEDDAIRARRARRRSGRPGPGRSPKV